MGCREAVLLVYRAVFCSNLTSEAVFLTFCILNSEQKFLALDGLYYSLMELLKTLIAADTNTNILTLKRLALYYTS